MVNASSSPLVTGYLLLAAGDWLKRFVRHSEKASGQQLSFEVLTLPGISFFQCLAYEVQGFRFFK
jgi:hypothetical protein